MPERNDSREPATYTVPRLMEGYQIARRQVRVEGVIQDRYYLQQAQPDGTWRDVRGPYKHYSHVKEWLRRQRFRELMAAKKRGLIVVFLDHEES